MSEIAAAVFVV